MKHVYALLPVLALTACTTFEPLRPDMEARPIPSRLDEIAYINGLRKAYEQVPNTDTKAVQCYDGAKLKAFRPKFVQGYRETDPAAEQGNKESAASSKLSEPSACLQFAMQGRTKAETDNTDWALRLANYTDNGFGLSDLYCSRFMIIAAETRQSRQMQKRSFAAVDVLIGNVLNAVSGSASLITSINNGFGLVGSTYDNIDNAFVITPEKDTLVRLVQAAQAAFRKAVRDDPPQSFARARSVIESYASMCTFDGMRGMINTSITKATEDLKSETKADSPPGNTVEKQAVTKKGTVVTVVPPKPPAKPATNAILPAF